jgi:hypothetical protein
LRCLAQYELVCLGNHKHSILWCDFVCFAELAKGIVVVPI